MTVSQRLEYLDLFSQAVEMSGSILAPWGISDNAEWLTKELLTHLALPAVGGQEAKEFLKNVSSQDVENALKKVIKVRTEAAYSMRFQIPSRKELNLARFGPRFDGDFFPKHVKELLKEAPKKPTLIGVTQEEALMMGKTQLRIVFFLLICLKYLFMCSCHRFWWRKPNEPDVDS